MLTAATRHIVAGSAGSKSDAKKAGKLTLIKPEPTVGDPEPTREVSTESVVALLGPPLIPQED